MVPDNGRYIRRSLDLIAESLLDVLHSGPGSDAKSQAAKCLGRVGYVLEQDFKRLVILYPVSCVTDLLYSLLKLMSSYVQQIRLLAFQQFSFCSSIKYVRNAGVLCRLWLSLWHSVFSALFCSLLFFMHGDLKEIMALSYDFPV
jgi:hypothetical protein